MTDFAGPFGILASGPCPLINKSDALPEFPTNRIRVACAEEKPLAEVGGYPIDPGRLRAMG